jgi:hypothetical protein
MAHETGGESQSPPGDDNYCGLLRPVGLGSRQFGHVGLQRAARTRNWPRAALRAMQQSVANSDIATAFIARRPCATVSLSFDAGLGRS